MTATTKAFIANIRGGAGPTGPVNPDFAPTDTAVAGWISTAGTSETQRALNDRYAHSLGFVPDDYGKLLPFYAALANRGSQRCTIAYLGDSITSGAFCTNFSTATTPARLTQILRARFPTLNTGNGRGWIRAAETTPGPSPIAVNTGYTNEGWGPCRHYAALTVASHTVTVTLTGTSFNLMYIKGPSFGIGSYKIDSDAPVNFDTAGSTVDGWMIHVTFATSGTHTVEVRWVSGGIVCLEGFIEFDGDELSGIEVANCGDSGSALDGWLSATDWIGGIAALQPSLVVLQFGTNDAGQDAEHFRGTLSLMIQSIRTWLGPDMPFVLSMSYQPGAEKMQVDPWQSYVTVAAEIADADPHAVLVDHSRRMPPGDTADAYGLYNADHIHPTDKGYAMIAETVAAAIQPR